MERESERRQVTVLFADISGFTRLSEIMDPEEVTVIVNDCFGVMGSIIEKNEGTIDKFMGDCIMALFGNPIAIEQAPQKAINAGIEIRNTINDIERTKKIKTELNVHIGINTGMVIAGPIGSHDKKELTVMGDVVNVASRLKDISEKGQIFVGLSTYNLTKSEFRFKKLDVVIVKGRTEPVAVFELLSEKEKFNRSGLKKSRLIHSEMVGRNSEFDLLSLHLSKVINGEGSIINVIGEAGIGKSRLIIELQGKREAKRVFFMIGRALSFGKNLSFHPIIDILKNWTGILEDDSQSQAYQKLESSIKRIFPDQSSEIFPFIAKLMSMKLMERDETQIKGIEGEALERLILKSLKELIIKAASIRPIVFVLEDLHWADNTSIDFLLSLYRLALDNRIFFVNVFRPNYKFSGDRVKSIVIERYPEIYQEIILESLVKEETELLINNLVKVQNIPLEIKDLIIKRACGNPFFIEEILRSFIDEGVLEQKGDNYDITEKIHSVIIPETINEILMSRIDKLDQDSKSLLKIASVIGRNFFYRILTEVAQDTGEIDDILTYLEGTQLIQKQQRMLELEYLFKHALAQEATYESILLKKRKEIHIKTAMAIEKVFSARLYEFYGMLAIHYSKGEDVDKTEEFLIKAGEEALKASASSEAIHYFQEALNIYVIKYGEEADPAKIATLERNIGMALQNKGHLAEAINYFDKVLLFYGVRFTKSVILNRIQTLWGVLHFMLGVYFPSWKWKKVPNKDKAEVIKLFFLKLNDMGVMNSKRLVSESFKFYKALTSYNLTKIDGGIGMFSGASVVFSISGISFNLSRRVLDCVKPLVRKDDIKSLIYYEFAEILYCYLSGNWHKSKEYDAGIVESALKIGEVLYTTYYLDIHICNNMDLGNYKKAHELTLKQGDIGAKFEHDFTKGLYHKNITKILMKFGRYDEALKSSKEEIEFLHKIGDSVQLYKGYSVRAKIHILMGDLTSAEKSLESANSIKLYRLSPLFRIDLYVSKFLFEISCLEREIKARNNLKINELKEKALITGRKSVALVKKIARDRTEIYKFMGTFFWLIDKQRKALSWWGKSIREGKRLNAKLELSRTYMEVGIRFSENKSKYQELNQIKAKDHLNMARSLFKKMCLQEDLEELEKTFPSFNH